MEKSGPLPARIDFSRLSWDQIMAFDSCTRCGMCVKWCPVYVFDDKEAITPRMKLFRISRVLRSQHSLISRIVNPDSFLGRLICPKRVSAEELTEIVQSFYECSTCRQCHFVCPSRIDTVELYEAVRGSLVKAGLGPLPNHQGLSTSSRNYDNPWQRPRSQRDRWCKVAQKEGRINELPVMLKPPKSFK